MILGLGWYYLSFRVVSSKWVYVGIELEVVFVIRLSFCCCFFKIVDVFGCFGLESF